MPAVTKDGRTVLEVISPELMMFGYEKITSLNTKKVLTPPTTYGGQPAPAAVEVMIRCENQGVRWRADGPDPTATDGMLLAAGETMYIRGSAMVKAIEFLEVAASATLHVSYWA